ncbi:MAG: hypothetical protein V4658_05725 [Bacteroidota bacterium]
MSVKLDEIRADRDKKIARSLRYFGVIMAIFYFVMGISFMVMPLFAYLGQVKYLVGALLICYSGFRFYRLMKKQPDFRNDD